ncbi:hypothetical protein Dda_4578 [Drechslerella dactyloides]|uniref:Uncharacterized protein n=1 Tax=Drechslerella dactyloides TaxID=74499 RepID=A0AAD6J1J8_DREDA|nr:hypothetical protein Dda_4578 [Drechslerella dactyloides]
MSTGTPFLKFSPLRRSAVSIPFSIMTMITLADMLIESSGKKGPSKRRVLPARSPAPTAQPAFDFPAAAA